MEKHIFCLLLSIEMIKIFESKRSWPLLYNIHAVKIKTRCHNLPLSEVGILS